jgi:hypothetical protein
VLVFLDFSEIPNNTGDAFEAFAYEFLDLFGYILDTPPSNGADGGRDGVVCAPAFGPTTTGMRYLLSCKHMSAHVGVNDDHPDYRKLAVFGCHAFMRVYSSVWTSGLQRAFEAVEHKHGAPVVVFGPYEIERAVISDVKYMGLIQQFMPQSFARLCDLRDKTDQGCCDYYNAGHDNRYVVVYQDQVQRRHVEHCCDSCRDRLEEALFDAGIASQTLLVRHALYPS